MSDLSEADRALVKWLAGAQVGDLLPEPFRDMEPNGTGLLIQRLVDAGVVHSVFAGQPIVEASLAAQMACRGWLEANG